MNDFTASNGRTIELGKDRYVIRDQYNLNALAKFDYLDEDDMQALREFFQAEADERLGRWRSPQWEHFVVYPDSVDPDVCVVVNEYGGRSHTLARDGRLLRAGTAGGLFFDVAAAYFDAHPEPKPWHDAEPGEVWELTVEGVTRTYASIASTGQNDVYVRFFPTHEVHAVTVGTKAPVISAGHRIFPEVAS